MKPLAVGKKILVLIDKAKQLAKTKLKSGLIVPVEYEYMRYNLQTGPIVSVGAEVDNPEVKVGRTAIFHHRIEAEEQNLIEVLPNRDEIRVVRTYSDAMNYQLYAVINEAGEIIPEPQFVFCEPEVKQDYTHETLIDPISHESVGFATRKQGSIYIAEVAKSDDQLLHHVVKVLFVSPKETELVPGDMIKVDSYSKYPIEIGDKTYWIITREYILTKNAR